MRWRSLFVVVAVLTAGCGSLVGADDPGRDRPTETLTPAPVPEVTPTPERWPVAPGVTGAGVADLDTLVAAHTGAAANTSYVWRERRGTTADPNATIPLFDRSVAEVASPSRYYVWTSEERVRLRSGLRHVANYSEFTGDGVRTIRYRLVGQSDYEYQRRHPVSASSNTFVGGAVSAALRRYLAVERATVSRTRVDGDTHYLVVGRNWTRFAGGEVTDYTVRALVSEDGFVRRLSATYTVQSVGQPRCVRYSFAYDRVGNTTVDPPGWVDDR
ncbi:MAG: hypothetical protein ABEI39_04660 [Halobacteriales archaeon]